ncbi:MAG TPA: SBBP repeat-containing protein [Pyrinomonadaceae bacterium]|nr:SBBP repeat-containing protein [Pyrinomonadaceae bacterium]
MVIITLVTAFTSLIFVAASNDNQPATESSNTATEADSTLKAKISQNFGRLPLSFEPNEGQVEQPVKFRSRGNGYDLFLTSTEAVLSLRKPRELQKEPGQPKPGGELHEGSVLRLKMIGANPAAHIEGRDELPGKVNYLSGSDPAKWHRNIPTYRKVYYKDVYPGIDIVYYGNQRELEYDFVIAPGADPKLIKFRIEGANKLSLDEKTGSLLLALPHGEVRLNKPFIYQHAEQGNKSEIKGTYAIKGNEVRFKVRGFDARKPLVIDPVLSYSTYLGSPSSEAALGIAVDSQGSAYVTGNTNSIAFPTTAGAFKTTSNFGGAFVTKLDPTGSSLVYSTYLNDSSSGSTSGQGIAVDASGNAYVTGFTTSPDFPLVNPLKTFGNFFRTTNSGANWSNVVTGLTGDVRAIGVTPAAVQIVYAGTSTGPHRSSDAGATWTKLPTTGAPAFPFTVAIAAHPSNSAVVYAGFINGGLYRSLDGGTTWGQVTLPFSNPVVTTIVFDPATPSTMFVASGNGTFKSTDSGATWTTLNFGTPAQPNVRSIAINPTTTSTIYAGTFGQGILKSTNGGSTWTPINNNMTSFESTFVSSVVIDPFNVSTIYLGQGSSGSAALVSKSTNGGDSWTTVSTGLPTSQLTALVADRTTANTLYAATAGGGVWKTTNGGTNWTSVNSGLWNGNVTTLVPHASNSAILFAGATGVGSQDAFVTKLNANGSGLLFSSYLGGSVTESGNAIAVDGAGNIYVGGLTTSANFPAVSAIQSAPSGTENCNNGFVTKINPAVPSFVFSTYLGGNRCDSVQSIAVDSSANAYVTGNTASSDFPVANAFQTNIAELSGDAFVTKFTPAGTLAYSTYLGGDNTDVGRGIAVDSSGQAYVTGSTSSSNFPTVNPIFGRNGFGEDVFVTKFNSSGSALVYSTYVGGESSDFVRGIAVDASGNAYVAGFTQSLHFPLVAGALRTESVYFKSVDGGASWSNDNYGLVLDVNASVNSLVVHPTLPSTIYAGTGAGVFKSTNGGRTWTRMNSGLLDTRVSTLVIDPVTPTTLYVVTTNFGNANQGIYKSTDGGSSWNLRKNGITSQAISLAIDPVSPNILYAGANNFGSDGKVFKTTDGGDSWVPAGVPPATSSFGSIAVDPHNHTRIFAAGAANNGALFRSVDSGATWNPIGFAQTGPFGNFIGVSPVTANLLCAQVGIGLFKSVDGGDNWSLVANNRFGTVVFDPVTSSTIYSVSQNEGLLRSTDGGQTFKSLNKGLNQPLVLAMAVDPLKPSTLHVAGRSMSGDDGFVFKINAAGSALLYSTLIGANPTVQDFFNASTQAFAIAVDTAGNAYITGLTSSPVFPTTPNSYQPIFRNSTDAFISKLTMSHIISGSVKDGSNAPVSGVDVVLNDGTSLTQVVTETDGSYEFSRLREGGNYTVSASKPHFTMAPPSQTFNNLTSNQTLNFTATASAGAFHTISGQITLNGTGLAGVTVTLSGSQSGLRTTDSNGNYSFELAAGGNYTVTPALLGFTFSPVNRTFNNLSANQPANFAATRQNFVVTNTNNHGTGSLREAIINANATAGTDTISFNIPGPGVKVISLVNTLPDIIDPVVIDGTTQPGYAGSPLIEIDGSNAAGGAHGFTVIAGGTTIRGLAIGRFSFGIAIFLRDCNNNTIQANHLGIDAAGTTVRANRNGILLSNSSNNLIGGTTAAARNVVSGNSFDGIEVGGSNNTIQGNYIGTNAAGTAALGNSGSGILIQQPTFVNNLIGGTSAGAGNLISGNQRGITTNGVGTTIQGNLIGTNAAGALPIANNGDGIRVDAADVLVGGLTPAARNIISGNLGYGVFLTGSGSKLQGNFIGTDVTGTLQLGNAAAGVSGGLNVLIGGTTPEARNVIAGNFGAGNIALGDNSSGSPATVQGNYIGTDVTGTKAIGSSRFGIAIFNSNNIIGGTAAGAGNVISGNLIGIQISVFNSGGNGNVIQGNLIGLNAQGTGALPNREQGILISDANNNIIGGMQPGAGNKIAFSGAGPGVLVSFGSGNSIRGNSIFSNNGLGIDLGTAGVTPNDGTDADTGPNQLQNFPVITTVSRGASSTTIQGTLTSIPNTTFQIDFYTNAAVDPSGNGEGALFFHTAAVTTNGSGNATINVVVPTVLPAGRVITATATDPNGNTSEFSAGDVSEATGSVQFNSSTFAVIEDVGLATITVQRVGGSSGTLTVDYATSNGTAIAGQDYTATPGTLTFANGETSKNIQIPILEDAPTEPDETFTLELKNASNFESLGPPSSMVITIQDRITVPSLAVFNGSVTEGAPGTTVDMLFQVRLSAATSRTIRVNYATAANGVATGGAACGTPGVDFEMTSGLLTFQPGNTSVTTSVKVCGDSSAESNETFALNLSNPFNATLFDAFGNGTIVNDDVIELVLEESSPIVNQAAALDALLQVRDPFRIVTVPELFANGIDRNTRVVLFVRNLQLNPGETPAFVIVRLVGSNNQIFNVQAEDFRAVPNTDLMQVVFRLPNTLPAGTTTVVVISHGRNSNMGTIRIVP